VYRSSEAAAHGGDLQAVVLVLGEFDGFTETETFMADLEMMDGAVGTFEVWFSAVAAVLRVRDGHRMHRRSRLSAVRAHAARVAQFISATRASIGQTSLIGLVAL
jgi:hypothetical protein